MTTRTEATHDLAVLAGLLEELTHQHLSIATDHEGRPAVIIGPSIAAQLGTLVREVARRARRLEDGT